MGDAVEVIDRPIKRIDDPLIIAFLIADTIRDERLKGERIAASA